MMKYIIIQAGGKGSRMGSLTQNKPKCLVSVNGMPLIFHIFNQYPKAKFFIISDYKDEVLSKYLKNFCKFDYEIIVTREKGTCAGIKKVLGLIPAKSAFALLWCDLYFEKAINFNIFSKQKNYIGLSARNFTCRWRFNKNILEEKRSAKNGVAGIYIFKNKEEIKTVPPRGEFCLFLKTKNIPFNSFFINGAHEIGTIESYNKFTKKFLYTRPFNKILINGEKLIKKPVSDYGKKIAKLETGWYKWAIKNKFTFLPDIYSYSPLVMQRISGKSLFSYNFSDAKKSIVLVDIINNLKRIHAANSVGQNINTFLNDSEAILLKTKKRLDAITNIIPFSNDDYIYKQ